MKRLIRCSTDINFNVDELNYLYHATYAPLLSSIQRKGLGNTSQTYWNDSVPGVVYLAADLEVAASYAEAAESVDEDWIDQIIVLKIPVEDLDESKLKLDSNVIIDDDTDIEKLTFEYHSIIPFSVVEQIIEYN